MQQIELGNRLQNKPSPQTRDRLAIARAIVDQPVMLLADEPTGALDSHTTQEILNIFTELNASGMTVIMITREAEVARCTRQIVLFRDGQIVDPYLAPEHLAHATFA